MKTTLSNKEALLDRIYQGSVASRLQFARQLHGEWGRQLTSVHDFFCTFLEMKERAEALARHMREMDMGRLCVRCSTSESGGCCSLYMAGETDAVQLLLNMLAGVTVDFVRGDGRECCFLGENGCIFMFKPMFCLNYNCHAIRTTASEKHMGELERLAGELLGKQYEAEQLIISRIGEYAGCSQRRG